jgi:hypothetical protein
MTILIRAVGIPAAKGSLHKYLGGVRANEPREIWTMSEDNATAKGKYRYPDERLVITSIHGRCLPFETIVLQS